jgi:hypothetical protein
LQLAEGSHEGGLLLDIERRQPFALAGVQLRQAGIHQVPRFVGELHQQLAAVGGVGNATDHPPFLKGVEERGHRATGHQQSLADDVRRQRLAGTFDDGEDLTCGRREAVGAQPTGHLGQYQVRGSQQVDHALGRRGAGAGELGLEVRSHAQRLPSQVDALLQLQLT